MATYREYEEFELLLSSGQSYCRTARLWHVFEGRGQRRVVLTNLGGVLGCWQENNDVPYNNSPADLEVMSEELSSMAWTDDLILAAVCLLKNKGYESLLELVPDLSQPSKFSFYYGHILKALFINENYRLETIGSLVNGRFNVVDQAGKIIDSCYYNLRENILSRDNEEQLPMINFLKQQGGRFLAAYIN